MTDFFKLLIKIFRFTLTSLKPIVFIALVFIIIASSLFAYDQYRTYQDRKLGTTLIDNVKIESPCREIRNASEKFDLRFILTNANDQSVNLEKIGIETSLLRAGYRIFNNLIKTQPKSLKTVGGNAQFEEYDFEPAVRIGSGESKTIVLTMQSASKTEARAAAHTIVVYQGEVSFSFAPEFNIASSCKIQVRYS